jgi:uncharacterized protein
MSVPDKNAERLFEEGIRLFNEGKFYQCHEVLEELWHIQTEPERQFTQGVIQFAVGTYHLLNDNPIGACKLYERALPRLRLFSPSHRGLDVSSIIRQAENLLDAASSARADFELPAIGPEEGKDLS